MKLYMVLNNDRPAQTRFCKVDKSWNNCLFKTLAEARCYLKRWLGDYRCISDTPFKSDVPYEYSGCGDTVMIRTIKL